MTGYLIINKNDESIIIADLNRPLNPNDYLRSGQELISQDYPFTIYTSESSVNVVLERLIQNYNKDEFKKLQVEFITSNPKDVITNSYQTERVSIARVL